MSVPGSALGFSCYLFTGRISTASGSFLNINSSRSLDLQKTSLSVNPNKTFELNVRGCSVIQLSKISCPRLVRRELL